MPKVWSWKGVYWMSARAPSRRVLRRSNLAAAWAFQKLISGFP